MRSKPDNENKIKIFKAAQNLFYQRGYIDTYVNEIIELSETSKGTFYHYYENKFELGAAVCENAVSENSVSGLVLKETDVMITNMVDIMIYWHLFFKDQRLRRFLFEINEESFSFKNDPFMEYCLKKNGNKFTHQELNLTLATVRGMRREIITQIFMNIDDYDAKIAADFSLQKIMQNFNFKKNIIKISLKQAHEQFDRLHIENEGFCYQISLKNEV